MAISPNSNVLYISNSDSIMQFDLSSINIAATQQTVAVYDSFQSTYPPWPPLGTYFGLGALAPDGKIYFTTGNSTLYMHVINYPDSLGLACNLVQHGIRLPAIALNTLPNHPNYFLGRNFGSLCDTITAWFSLQEHPPSISIKCFPNPSTGIFTLNFPVQSVLGNCEIYDVNGRCVFKESVAQWSQYKHVDITKQPSGIYFVKMSWGTGVGSVKVVKE